MVKYVVEYKWKPFILRVSVFIYIEPTVLRIAYFFCRLSKQALDKKLTKLIRSGKMETDRRKEVVNACLNLFVERGLYKTSTRDLSKALSLQSGGLYYYFQTKDDAVVACVEEAISRLEDTLIVPVKKEIFDPTI